MNKLQFGIFIIIVVTGLLDCKLSYYVKKVQ